MQKTLNLITISFITLFLENRCESSYQVWETNSSIAVDDVDKCSRLFAGDTKYVIVNLKRVHSMKCSHHQKANKGTPLNSLERHLNTWWCCFAIQDRRLTTFHQTNEGQPGQGLQITTFPWIFTRYHYPSLWAKMMAEFELMAEASTCDSGQRSSMLSVEHTTRLLQHK